MLICHCNAVTERKIRKTIRSGALCLDSVTRACGAGGGCGGCTAAISEILDHELELRQASAPTAEPPDSLELLLVPS